MPTRTIVNALALLDHPARFSSTPVDVFIDGTRIADIRPAGTSEPAGDVVDANGLLLTPGLVNGHTHSHENFAKGRYENLPLEVWMNFVRPPDAVPMTARQVYLRTMVGAIEALRSGTTTVVDDLNVSPILVPEHVEAVFQAYEDAGIRALVAPGMFDQPFFKAVPFVEETFPPALLAELGAKPRSTPEEILSHVTQLLRERHPRSRRVAMAVSPSAPQRCSESFLLRLRRLADDHDLPIVIHVQETRLQVVTGQLFYGCTMIEYLDRIGFLRPGVSLIHGVWLNPREIDILARTGATLQHNPTSNLSLGSGLCPVRELLAAGVNVSLGTDACGSSFTMSMLKAVNNTALIQKLRSPDHEQWVSAAEAWAAATVQGARALGLDDRIGRLSVGMTADIVGYSLRSPAFTPLNDALRQLVYAESGQNLALVVVDGEVVMEGGTFTRFDEPKILAETASAHEGLAAALDRADASVGEMRAAYEAIYRRCLEHPIAADTLPALFDVPNAGCGHRH